MKRAALDLVKVCLGIATSPACAFLIAAAPQLAGASEASFKSFVEPILVGRCLECHGSALKGGLDLRSNTTAMAGGKSGVVIVPGDPEASLLFKNVRDQIMPPKYPLDATEVEALRQWIAAGAYYPDTPLDPFAVTTDKRAGYDWWSLQPLHNAVPPDIAANDPLIGWPLNAIDRFILAKQRENGLVPAIPATPRVLIRRATYDLTGLPPSPEEVAAFESACAAETGAPDRVGDAAYAALIDRLLASPHYGEQWGRHWLDVARYGESTGYEVNHLIDTIWPYRDYVIRSFSDDKPFSRVVLEHLAGDAVDPGNPDVEVGLTFLVCGPYDIVGNLDPVQAAQIRANTVDDMVRATSEAFLGLTVGCARCHDHKFDPISQRDYYRMFATFAGVHHEDRVVAPEEKIAERAALLDPLETERASLVTAKTGVEDAILARAEARIAEFESQWIRPPVDRNGTEETFPPVSARHVRLTVDGRDDDPYATSGYRIDEFEVFSATDPQRNVALASNGGKAEGESHAAEDFGEAYVADLVIDGTYGARWNARGPILTITFAQTETIDRIVFSSDRPKALKPGHGEVTFPGEYRIEVSEDGSSWTEIASTRDRKPASDRHRRKRLIDAEITEDDRAELARLDAEMHRVQAAIAAIPELPRLRVGKMEKPAEPQRLFLGGDPQRISEAIVPASLDVLARTAGEYQIAADQPEQDRRLALAEWIVSDTNPLPPRVLANRLWHYHFGTGLVSTPSDFGFMGTPPSHPELLDWLARELSQPRISVETGEPLTPEESRDAAWRMKRIHKLIMLSTTYRQSSNYDEAAARVDGDARLLWRFPPRRLSGEELRDTMLAVAGKLDTRMGGPGFQLYDYLRDNVATYNPKDSNGPETYRRAVYHQQARAMQIDLMTDFDAPDCALSAPRRASTTTPMQALTLLNHSFTLDMAKALAARIVAESSATDPQSQVQRAFALAFNREPSINELEQGATLVQTHGLKAFCRALLNSNEFIYLN